MTLSPFLYGLSELIGLSKAMLLVEAYGGTSLYVPQSVDAKHKLALLIGLAAAQKLVSVYPGETITIALHATGDHAKHGAIRRHKIKEMSKQKPKPSHREIARELRTTDRTVRKVLGAEANDKQKKLF
jgi:hypothetical protein